MVTTFVQELLMKSPRNANFMVPLQNLLDIYHEPKEVQNEVSILWKITLKIPQLRRTAVSENIQELLFSAIRLTTRFKVLLNPSLQKSHYHLNVE